MAIIIETCPKCGHDLVDEVICTCPPIPKKSCWSCGWSWTGKQEEIMRMPFDVGGNFNVDSKHILKGSFYNELIEPTIDNVSEEDIQEQLKLIKLRGWVVDDLVDI